MRLSWECHDESEETNWHHFVTGPKLSFFHKRKGRLKINQSIQMPWDRLSMAVVCSYSLAPGFDPFAVKKTRQLAARKYMQRMLALSVVPTGWRARRGLSRSVIITNNIITLLRLVFTLRHGQMTLLFDFLSNVLYYILFNDGLGSSNL